MEHHGQDVREHDQKRHHEPYEHDEHHEHDRHPIEIRVNRQPVRMPHRRASGLGIKEAAIAQGVKIELDFVLSRRGDPHPIGDDDIVDLHEGEQFSAIAPDDNS